MDTLEVLQAELADLKRAYMRGPQFNEARDRRFAEREAALGRRFLAIGAQPSYPDGFLEGLRGDAA